MRGSTISSSRPGRVFIEPVRKARQKHAGTIAWLNGYMVVCIGYSEDGLTAVYATREQLGAIKMAVQRAEKSPLHKLLLHLISKYERRI